MFSHSLRLPKSLLAGAAAVAILAVPSAGQAAWPSFFGKRAPQATEAPVVEAQAEDGERLGRIEAQMRNLTGQIEELTFQLKTLQDQLKRAQEDSDFRFRELEGGTASAKSAAPADQPAQAAAPPPPTAKGAPPAAVATAEPPAEALGEPPKPLGTLVLDGPPSAEKPLDLSSIAGGSNGAAAASPPPAADGVAVASIAPTGDARADYDQAYKLVNAGRYDLAESAFRQFLTAYPKDELAPDAQYWLGESLYNHGDYAAAAEEFKNGYTKYPKAKRAPDTLLKLGLSLAGLGFRDDACKMYAAALSKYPQMSNGLRQRVKTEQASAAC